MEEASSMSDFTSAEKTKILKLKSDIASYYDLTMKKLGNQMLTSMFFNDCIITGGCISALWHGEKVNDIDLYAKDLKSMKKIRDMLTDPSNNTIVKKGTAYELDTDDGPTLAGKALITNNAVTLANDVQFVYLGAADECRKKFDFIHCMPWYDLRTQKLYISQAQVASIRTKTLIPNNTGEKIKERRIKKYTDKGWNDTFTVKPVTFSWSEYNIPGIVAQEIGEYTPVVYK
jgi:hypothetical protein